MTNLREAHSTNQVRGRDAVSPGGLCEEHGTPRDQSRSAMMAERVN